MTPGDEARLTELFVACFGHQRSLDEFRWRYQAAPFPSQVHVAVLDEHIVGAAMTQVLPVWVLGYSSTVSRVVDLMVDPLYRRRGVARALQQTFRPSLREQPLAMHFPAEVTFRLDHPPESTINRAGQLPQWVRWDTARGVREDEPRMPRAVAELMAITFRAASSATSLSARRVRCDELTLEAVNTLGADFDLLSDRSRSIAPCVMQRGFEHVRWRWFDRPDPWRLVVAQGARRRLAGYAVFQMRGENCQLGDILSFDPATMRALLGRVSTAAASSRPGRTLLELNDPRPWARSVLRQAGFLPRGVGPAVSLRVLNERLPQRLESLSSWYLTAGDTDLV